MLRGVDRETAPSASDFKHMIRRIQFKQAAEPVVFSSLRLFKAHYVIGEIGAGVRHRRIEKRFEKIIAQVIVIRDVRFAVFMVFVRDT